MDGSYSELKKMKKMKMKEKNVKEKKSSTSQIDNTSSSLLLI